MKKKFMMLSCIAAVAIATVVGKKTFESHAYETNSLLMQSVEALANGSDGTQEYNWSHPQSCPGLFSGSYCTCEQDGPGNSCSEPGAKTCTCGKNC